VPVPASLLNLVMHPERRRIDKMPLMTSGYLFLQREFTLQPTISQRVLLLRLQTNHSGGEVEECSQAVISHSHRGARVTVFSSRISRMKYVLQCGATAA
jgi:hypothetical protein